MSTQKHRQSSPAFVNALVKALYGVSDDLPQDVYADLVDSLYGSFTSLVAGAVTSAVAGALTAYMTGSPYLIASTAMIALVGLLRIVLMLCYRKMPLSKKTNQDMRKWEILYGLGAGAFAISLGMLSLLGFVFVDNDGVHLMTSCVTIGYAAGISGRNAGRPKIAVMQIVCAAGPLSLGLALKGEFFYGAQAVMIVFFFLSTREVSHNLHRTIVNAALNAARLDMALSNMSHGLAMFDPDLRTVVCNTQFSALYGIPTLPEGKPTSIQDILAACVAAGTLAPAQVDDVIAEFRKRINSKCTDSYIMHLNDMRTLSLTYRQMALGGLVVLVEDITERKLAEQRIAHMARYDGLTGLPNRNHLRDSMDDSISRRESFSVLCVDLDKFKAVNDTLGHPVGDALLKEVAHRLTQITRETDLVARFGGDEFVVLQTPSRNTKQADALANKIVNILSEPYDVQGHHVVIGASVGIAVAPKDGDSADRLIKNADMALYRAKSQGRGTWRFFEAQMDAEAQARRQLELDMNAALANGEFEVHYQPQLDLETGAVSTCEALVRWRHPQRGMISPAEFIPVAEETGQIVAVGEWVLRQACLDAKGWPEEVRVAVNLSAVQFQRGNLLATIRKVLAETGLPAGRLELEITESTLIHDVEACKATIQEMTRLGIRISLDDFGTGYSSLMYLRSLPFQKVKIDRSFVTDIVTRTDASAIIKAVSILCSDMDMALTVEGVETAEQVDILSDLGCTNIQGYYFSPPVRVEKVVAILAQKREGVRAKRLHVAA